MNQTRWRLAGLAATMASVASMAGFGRDAMVYVPRRLRNDPERLAAADAKRARKNATRLRTWTGFRN